MKAAKAIELITPIPSENFMLDKFSDEEGKCCVIGHLSRLISETPNDYSIKNCKDLGLWRTSWNSKAAEGKEEVYQLRQNSREFLSKHHKLSKRDISYVNNYSSINGYKEPEVKDRVLHLLKDMDAAGY